MSEPSESVPEAGSEAPGPAPTRGRRLRRVVVAGRPNVGKSTLVNRIVGRRVAIVESTPGVTRDRFELEANWLGERFVIVDTGGILERGDALDKKVTAQAERALAEGDLILFVLDATTGVTGEDEAVAQLLRRHKDKVIPIANKVDSSHQEADAWALSALGYGEPVQVSALHGRSVGDLLDVVVARLRERPEDGGPTGGEAAEPETGVLASVAIVGRPNVGKSTLFNRLIGEDRVIVHDLPGTTRDAIDTLLETEHGTLRLIDTAGLRRQGRYAEGSEYYSLVRSLAAIDRADVALLLIDATEGVTHQEQRLAERVDLAGSPIVLVVNKWDLIATEARLAIAEEIGDKLGFLSYAPVLRISAKTGLGVHRLLPAVVDALEAYRRRVPTAALNEALKRAQSRHPAPGARVLYGVQGATDPPTITLFATKRLTPGYLRYLEHQLREEFSFGPTPLKLRVRQRGS